MAVFMITPADSKVTGFFPAFEQDTLAADTLTVDPSAFLITTGLATPAVYLGGLGGAWTSTINGSVVSTQDDGIFLDAGAVTSTIIIGKDGQVGGGTSAIQAASTVKITNSGILNGGSFAAIEQFGSGPNSVANSGYVNGFISGIAIRDNFGTANDTITNSGTIVGAIVLAGGTNVLKNSGDILGTVNSTIGVGAGDDSITNSGFILSDIELGGGTLNKLTNSGTINGIVFSSSTKSTITNSGTIMNLALFAGDDTVINTGKIGSVSLGAGNDKYTGGNSIDQINDSAGADVIKLGGGDDFYTATGGGGATDGIDTLDGGAGIDLYTAFGTPDSVFINLDTIAHSLSGGPPFTVAANTATGTDVAGALSDKILGFENAVGGGGADQIFGSSAANTLYGSGAGDRLFGFAGNDRLFGDAGFDDLFGGVGNDELIGGSGEDVINGGAGKDILRGEADGDIFSYESIKDSGITAATRDVIWDFTSDGLNGDVISLSTIDANTTNGAAINDAFSFIGTNVKFTGAAGQLRAYWSANGQIIEGDVNGDAKADFSIEIVDPNHLITLVNTANHDFVL
jgi:Ca2+-binding RTX toxin-like protein